MIILDTNVISEWFKPKPNSEVIDWLNAQIETNLFITSITVGEIMFGAYSLPKGRRAVDLQNRVAHLADDVFYGRILPFDATAAYYYGMDMAQRRKDGVAISIPDGQIASIARANNYAAIATRDTTPFEAFRLDVINPWDTGSS